MSVKMYQMETLIVAGAVVMSACLGDDHRHIEQQQYTPEPQLTYTEWISTLSGTQATLGQLSGPFTVNP